MSEPAPTIEERRAELEQLRKEEADIAWKVAEVEQLIRRQEVGERIHHLRTGSYEETVGEDHNWIGFSEVDTDGVRQLDFYQGEQFKGYLYVGKDMAVDLVETLQRLYGVN